MSLVHSLNSQCWDQTPLVLSLMTIRWPLRQCVSLVLSLDCSNQMPTGSSVMSQMFLQILPDQVPTALTKRTVIEPTLLVCSPAWLAWNSIMYTKICPCLQSAGMVWYLAGTGVGKRGLFLFTNNLDLSRVMCHNHDQESPSTSL